jgi:hypothetical protein
VALLPDWEEARVRRGGFVAFTSPPPPPTSPHAARCHPPSNPVCISTTEPHAECMLSNKLHDYPPCGDFPRQLSTGACCVCSTRTRCCCGP